MRWETRAAPSVQERSAWQRCGLVAIAAAAVLAAFAGLSALLGADSATLTGRLSSGPLAAHRQQAPTSQLSDERLHKWMRYAASR